MDILKNRRIDMPRDPKVAIAVAAGAALVACGVKLTQAANGGAKQQSDSRSRYTLYEVSSGGAGDNAFSDLRFPSPVDVVADTSAFAVDVVKGILPRNW